MFQGGTSTRTLQPLLEPWTPELRAACGVRTAVFTHRLAETGLFSDDALGRLLDLHPRADLEVAAPAQGCGPGEPLATGEVGDLSGAELVAAVNRGRLCLTLLGAMNVHPAYQSVLARLLREFGGAAGRLVLERSGSIVLSSPGCGEPFGFARTEALLCQVRGAKTLYVYPLDEQVAPERVRAAALFGVDESLVYRPALDALAETIRLEAGQAAAWPLHAPHRSLNAEAPNVSIRIDYATPGSALASGVIYTNHLLRRVGLGVPAARAPRVLAPVWWAASKALRGLARPTPPAPEPGIPPTLPSFRVDPAAPGAVAWSVGRSGEGAAE